MRRPLFNFYAYLRMKTLKVSFKLQARISMTCFLTMLLRVSFKLALTKRP